MRRKLVRSCRNLQEIMLEHSIEDMDIKGICLRIDITSRYIHLNPVKARMVSNPEDYKWSSYRRIINLCDDGITTSQKTLSYFGNKSIWGYREFVEDIANKYVVTETEIRTVMGEDELWLPW